MLQPDLPVPAQVIRAAEAALEGRVGCVVLRARGHGRRLIVAGRQHALAAHPLGSIAKIPAILALSGSPGPLTWTCAGPKGQPPCWTRHGRVDTARLLAHSCSTAAALLGESVGRAGLLASLERSGFGQPTGAGLGPEAAGTIPGDAAPGQLASGRAWGLSATPLQVARMMQQLADLEGKARREPLVTVLHGLRLGVREGTAAPLDKLGYVAGKTGTAPAPSGGRDGWFAGWTHRWVVVAWVRGGAGYGAARDVAARVARKLGAGS
jgi:cell division protein FtsI/penicillin-binding protein 2